MAETDLGKKVFFLYPPSVIKDELITRLRDKEFEIYMFSDMNKFNRIIRLYPDSICFINIDAGMDEPKWEEWIRTTIADPALAQLKLGIVTYNSDEQLQKKYLMDIGLQCGFIKLKLGLEESTRILITILQANEAKGRRKYVRAFCSHDTISGVNIRTGSIETSGKIFDISVVGFSCILNPDPGFVKNSLVPDIQLKLRASLVRASAIVFGSRMVDDRTMYVMLFSQKMDDHANDRIRAFIQNTLQTEIEIQADTADVITQPDVTDSQKT